MARTEEKIHMWLILLFQVQKNMKTIVRKVEVLVVAKEVVTIPRKSMMMPTPGSIRACSSVIVKNTGIIRQSAATRSTSRRQTSHSRMMKSSI